MSIKDKLLEIGFYSSFKDLLKKVKKNPRDIKFIADPTEEMQLIAINYDLHLIADIQNPTEKVQLKAVEDYHLAIQYIQNPTEKVQLFVLKKQISYFFNINNPTDNAILYFISNGGNYNSIDVDKISDELAEKIYEILIIKDVLE